MEGSSANTESEPGNGGDPHGMMTESSVARLMAEISARLGPVCRGWDAAEFEAVVREIARRKLRWGDGPRSGPGDVSHPSDRLVPESGGQG